MKYLIDDEQVTEQEFNDRLEEEVNNYVEDNYDDILDECYPEVHIGDLSFSPSIILRECDPIAYNCGISDEESYRLGEAKSDLERGPFTINGYTFEEEWEEEEEEED